MINSHYTVAGKCLEIHLHAQSTFEKNKAIQMGFFLSIDQFLRSLYQNLHGDINIKIYLGNMNWMSRKLLILAH